jgi:hypothetical protein
MEIWIRRGLQNISRVVRKVMRRLPERSLSNANMCRDDRPVTRFFTGLSSGDIRRRYLGGGGHTAAVFKSFRTFHMHRFELDARILERTKKAFKEEGVEAELVAILISAG